MKKLHLYEKILLASNNGRGMRLSPAEVHQLACDDAILQVAERLAAERENAACIINSVGSEDSTP